ncbi:HlyD family secretion protein [Sphingobium nicotianae]|uniref:HlyD family efflux transporter periplasmic adaptor subunit n=1 Tax=Sphingobium nicotianae TaxID=2782607 RepID=A0A9X1IT72_9SPHN|nr:HlyD family efflux transporter periplasmic adaptor subunit [Sphingobium nicotianae]MBT2189015.1 HlyD family efflux transporter periplasmic adaptor subunit [Sphingobium nicotianae]
MQLFRQQALDHQHRLHGEVFLVPPLRWQAIGWLLLSFVAAAALFITLGSYSRTVTANGTLRPTGGVASIAVPEDGVVSAVLVRDGETVRQGQVIARLMLPQLAGGQSLAEQRQSQLAREQSALTTQRSSARSEVEENGRKLSARILDEQRQLGAIDAQIASQQALIKSSEQELSRIESVAQSGFISGRDLQQRRELLITRRQRLAELQQTRSLHGNALSTAQIELGEIGSHMRAGQSGFDAQLAALRREGATLGNAGTVDLVASRTGTLTALRYREGESVSRGELYGRIVPAITEWQIELKVPTSTIAQVAPGQDVRVSLAAYPVPDYGVLHGVVDHVGAAPVEDGAESYFLVTARLDPPSERQRQRGMLLRSDLALQARIVLARRSFLQWLIDPLAAVAQR